MARKINWLEILFWIIMIILFIMILSRIFGNSATDVQIYITLVMGMITIMGYIMRINREIGEIKIQMMSGFNKVREDINNINKINKKSKTKAII